MKRYPFYAVLALSLILKFAPTGAEAETIYENLKIVQTQANAQLLLDSAQSDILHLDNGVLKGLIRFGVDGSGATFNIQDRTSTPVSRLFVNGLGNVGIGTTNPLCKLEVNGGIRSIGTGVAELRLTSGSGADWEILTGYAGAGSVGNLAIFNSGGTRMVVAPSGNVGIGATNPQNKLDVNGTIRAKEVIVESNWADYVFEEGYELMSLDEVERHIATEKRLPGIPSAAEVAENGVSLAESQAMLLKKLEELTLYLIDVRKDQKAKNEEIAALRKELADLNHIIIGE